MRTSCPSCNAELTLRFSSLVCSQCRTVVARASQGGVRSVGQAELFQSQSSFSLGMQGEINQKFTLVGHVQFQHPMGGVWDEWYAVFEDGNFGWLAEAQGKFFMTFASTSNRELPAFESCTPGQKVWLPSSASGDGLENFTINEKGMARVIAAEGDIPYVLNIGASYNFVDLSGPAKEFATINYREATVFDANAAESADAYRQAPASTTEIRPHLYVGREYSLEELSLRANPNAASNPANISCPSCGEHMSLQAPGTSERVACPSCGAVSELNRNSAQQVGQSPRPGNIEIPLGTQARFEGEQMLVIGYLRRSALFDGERFGWEEYLLYHKNVGFRWLVKGDTGWSFVKPLNPGQVSDSGGSAHYEGTSYHLHETCRARVDVVMGEFYWKVSVGEEVDVADYRAGARSLSKEQNSNEVNWSYGENTSVATIELATNRTLAPMQINNLYSDYSDDSSTTSNAGSQVITWIIIIAVFILLMIMIDSCDGGGGGGGYYFGSFRGGK
jgi:hypothetical protein